MRECSQYLNRSSSFTAPNKTQLSTGGNTSLWEWQTFREASPDSHWPGEEWGPLIWFESTLVDTFENTENFTSPVPTESSKMAHPPLLEDRDPLAGRKGTVLKLGRYLTKYMLFHYRVCSSHPCHPAPVPVI